MQHVYHSSYKYVTPLSYLSHMIETRNSKNILETKRFVTGELSKEDKRVNAIYQFSKIKFLKNFQKKVNNFNFSKK